MLVHKLANHSMAVEFLNKLGSAATEAWQVFQGDIRGTVTELQRTPGVLTSLKHFADAIDWNERWIQGLIAFEIVLFTTVVLKRNNQAILTTTFAISVGVVATLERINSIAAQHWQLFAGQNYFDQHGIFVGAILGAPLLLIMFTILVIYVMQLGGMLVVMKRMQLKAEYRKRIKSD